MATVLYLESTGAPNISPTPNAGWTDQSQFTRFKTGTIKLSSAMVTDNISDVLSTQADIIIGQWISDFLDVGQTITGAQAVNIVARFAEVAANNNLFLTWAVYVFNGTTLNKTVVTKRTDGTEVVATTPTSRTDSATSVAGNYTTVAGDRLVIEVGLSGDPSGTNTHDGSMSYGSDSATDLTMADGTTTANNPIVTLTDTLTFNTSSPSPSVSPSVSPSASMSPSASESSSVSPSASSSPSSSESLSVSPSGSVSPSSSESPSASPSASVSPSPSESPSVSPSSSASLSVSPSASISPSSSTSPSPPPPPPEIVFLDPGGDAVQGLGYFALAQGTNAPTFDPSQKVVGIGSYKFDSGAGNGNSYNKVVSVLGQSRRMSLYVRVDSVPDTSASLTDFVDQEDPYSNGGFSTVSNMQGDDGTYGTATPAQNDGQGTVFHTMGIALPQNAVIDSVKIIYERKYDVNTSIGISRVKVRVNGVEGPDHDNTDMPLTDTVVEVDVTGDRGWEYQDFANGVFEVIAEARRGNTATSHTQSWDYVKVEIEYHTAISILYGADINGNPAFKLGVLPSGSGLTLRLTDGANFAFDGITVIPPDEDHRIVVSYLQNGTDDLDIKLYVDGIEELSLDARDTGIVELGLLVDLLYGWIDAPGANQVCWVDQLYIDDGSDLSDPGNKLSTAKRGASVNADNFDTTGGTGAVNERPVNLANYCQQAGTQVSQNYTLETAAAGDVDISGETLVGHMGWVIAKRGALPTSTIAMTLNGSDTAISPALTVTGSFRKLPVTSASYPSNAAGIGLLSSANSSDTFLYECGVIVAYEGPAEDMLLPFQLLEEDSVTPLVDDLRAAPPASYELCYRASELGGVATITVSSLDQEGGEVQQQAVIPVSGGSGRRRITAGIEVQISVVVTGGDIELEIWHRMNFD